MSMFKNLKKDDSIEKPKDSLGGFSALPSGIYQAKVKQAFADEAQSGAQKLVLIFDVMHEGKVSEYRETIFYTTKEGSVTYNKNGNKGYLPGFVTIDELCAVTSEQYLADQETENKVVKIYDYEARKEVPKEKPVLINLLDTTCLLGIHQIKKYKEKKIGDKYKPVDIIEEKNEINKVFNENGFTLSELIEEADVPNFKEKWEKRFSGKVIDKTKNVTPVSTTSSNTSEEKSAPKKSLFTKG